MIFHRYMENGRAKCLHRPRVLDSRGRCVECMRIGRRRSFRKRQGYDSYYAEQKGLCAWCGLPLGTTDDAHLDHDHVTGRKRGLVHRKCNQDIGGFERTLETIGLDAALRYTHR